MVDAHQGWVRAVAVDPTNSDRVWVCNRDNDSVSLIDYTQNPPDVTEVGVGINPRSLALSADGSKLFVASEDGIWSTDGSPGGTTFLATTWAGQRGV